MNSSKQIKLGALMSYFAIAFNMLSGLIYTPWMISQIGQSNYGLYTLANSLITMFVMDFGMSAAVTRFVSKYRAEGNQKGIDNLLGLVYKLYLCFDAVISIAVIVVYFFIETFYVNLTPPELETFKILYIIVGLFSVISFPFANLNGILIGYEQFAGQKLCDLFHKVFIVVVMVIALLLGYGVYALVLVNAFAGLFTLAIKLLLIKKKTPVKVNWSFFDKGLLKEIFGFSVWTTVASLAQRLIFNITPSIIAAVSVTGSVGVATFGLAQTIEGYVYTFATAINGMFMPRISKLVHEGKKDTDLMELMIKIGRIQCMLIGLLCVGFITLGKSFIVDIWNKPDFADSYLCAVFLILPSFIFLPLEIANTTVIVENKVKLQSYVYVVMGLINVCLSFVLSKYWGALGASISIFISYMVRTALMIVIHIKVLHLDIWRFCKQSFFKITPFLIITTVIGLLVENYNPMPHGYIRFIINGIVVVGIFGFLMFVFVMNKYEKDLIFGMIKKVFQKLRKGRMS